MLFIARQLSVLFAGSYDSNKDEIFVQPQQSMGQAN